METETAQATHWRSNILIILAVLGAILLALILAQLDNLNELIVPLPTTVAELPAAGSGDTDGGAPAQPTPIPSLTPVPANTSTPESAEATVTFTPTATPTSNPGYCNNTPSNWIPYIVQPGDTLYSLSIRSGATMQAIAHANCLASEYLIAGTVIYLPATPPVLPPCGPPSYWIIYTVQYGDTLYSLAQRTGTTVYTIMQANCLTSTYIYAGQSLYLPTYPVVTPTPTMPTPTATLPTATITSTPPITTTTTATPTGTIIAIPSATPTATVTGTILPTMTNTPTSTGMPTVLPTTTPTSTGMPTALPTVTSTGIPTLPPPPPTSLPTAYPPGPGPTPTLPPPPTAYP